MLPLFSSGLLSYLVWMKVGRGWGAAVGASHARDNCPCFVMYLSPLMSEVYLLINLFSKFYVTFIFQWIAFIFGKDVSYAREKTLLASLCTCRPWCPRFTFWLTLFFQSSMLPLFFSGLLSYLVVIKRRTSRHVACKGDNSHTFRYVLISLDDRGLPFG